MSGLEKQHAPLPPSGASCWVRCGMYRAMLAAYGHIQEESDAAREGTAAHWVWEQMARGLPVPAVGSHAPNGVEITEEMIEGAELMQSIVGDASKGHIEEAVSMGDLVHPDNWGTPDFWDFGMGRIRVIDYKFGHGYVDEFQNWQLIDYAAGIMEKLVIEPRHMTEIELIIVQPRCFARAGTVRNWLTNSSEIQPFIAELKAAANGDGEAHTGDHCEYCPGRSACVALLNETQRICDWSSVELPLELPPESMGREYDRLLRAEKAIKARRSGIEEMIAHQIRTGAAVNGWSLEQSVGRQRWSRPVEEVIALGKLMGIDLSKLGVITPKQAVKAGLSDAMVATVSETPPGEMKLVRVDTRRAVRAFNNA